MSVERNQVLKDITQTTTFRMIDGVSIRFVESEPANTDALLLSPWPESVMAYEPTWSRLAETTHLVAIDLPGFGRSERKDALMSPRAMGEFIVRAADAFGLDNPHIVGPDIGTSAVLFAAAAEHSRSLTCSPTRRSLQHSETSCRNYRRRADHCRPPRHDAGHFTWEDAADEYAALVNAWWAGRYKHS